MKLKKTLAGLLTGAGIGLAALIPNNSQGLEIETDPSSGIIYGGEGIYADLQASDLVTNPSASTIHYNWNDDAGWNYDSTEDVDPTRVSYECVKSDGEENPATRTLTLQRDQYNTSGTLLDTARTSTSLYVWDRPTTPTRADPSELVDEANPTFYYYGEVEPAGDNTIPNAVESITTVPSSTYVVLDLKGNGTQYYSDRAITRPRTIIRGYTQPGDPSNRVWDEYAPWSHEILGPFNMDGERVIGADLNFGEASGIFWTRAIFGENYCKLVRPTFDIGDVDENNIRFISTVSTGTLESARFDYYPNGTSDIIRVNEGATPGDPKEGINLSNVWQFSTGGTSGSRNYDNLPTHQSLESTLNPGRVGIWSETPTTAEGIVSDVPNIMVVKDVISGSLYEARNLNPQFVGTEQEVWDNVSSRIFAENSSGSGIVSLRDFIQGSSQPKASGSGDDPILNVGINARVDLTNLKFLPPQKLAVQNWELYDRK